MKITIKIILLNCFLTIISCKNEQSETTPDKADKKIENEVSLTEEQMKHVNVAYTQLQTASIQYAIKTNGKIDVEPENFVSISLPLGGYMKHTQLLPGMRVRKGEVIATVEDQQYIQLQQDYLLSKSKLHFAELEYKRQIELAKTQASSDKMLQQAESEMRLQQINMNSYAEKLKLININPVNLNEKNISKNISIYAPVNGFVTAVHTNIGKYANPTDVLFEFINPSSIHLNIKVFEKDLSSIKQGDKVICYTNANTTKKYNSTIFLINKNIESDGRCDVHCHFQNVDNILVPGMYMNAEIHSTFTTNNALPTESVLNYENKNYVFIESGNKKFTMQEVQLGTADKNYVEIMNIQDIANKKIVHKGAYTLLMTIKNMEMEE